MLISSCVTNANVVCAHHRILLRYKEKRNEEISKNVDQSREDYISSVAKARKIQTRLLTLSRPQLNVYM